MKGGAEEDDFHSVNWFPPLVERVNNFFNWYNKNSRWYKHNLEIWM